MIHEILHWLAVHTGTVNEPGPWYGFFSGFGSDLGEVTLIGAVAVAARKHTCHVHRCWRLSWRSVDGTEHSCCRRHHPDGKRRLSHAQVLTDHRIAKSRETR